MTNSNVNGYWCVIEILFFGWEDVKQNVWDNVYDKLIV